MAMDSIIQEISEVQKLAKNYPDLAKRLIEIGIESYTVDVATEIILYRKANGNNGIKYPEKPLNTISPAFNREQTIQAIRDNQQGKSDYPTFMRDIAKAGVRFYEATLTGDKKRVTYIGSGGSYEEEIPL